jgi:putative transcriptional regulator
MDERLLFETPIEDRWQAAGRLLGVNLLHLSSDAGHA